MSYNPFIFVKSFEERLKYFKSVLMECENVNKVQEVWSSYVEESVEPAGWQALWKMSRDLCLDLKISYPCTVVVCVEHINISDLSCRVSVDEVEDERVSLPEKMDDVPLIQLYPIEEQDTLVALPNLYDTAELIDSMRLFYNHLWMPWDLEADLEEGSSWVENHLEGRLQLLFLMMERKLPDDIAYTVRKLTAKGRKVHREIDIQEEELMEVEGRGMEENSARLLQLTKLHNTLSQIRYQFNIYEKPHLLKALLEEKSNEEKAKEEISESAVFLVLTNTTPDQLALLTSLAKQLPKDKKISVVSSLQEALVRAPAGTSVWLSQKTHHIQDLGTFECGGTIMGIHQEVEVTDDPEICLNLDVIKGSLMISTLTLRLTTNLTTIRVRPGAECHLNGVKVEGTATIDGIDVYTAASFTAVNCHFSSCNTALSCDFSSTVTLRNCTFADNNVALELKEGVDLTMENCTFSGSKMFGIQIVVPRLISVKSVTKVQDINNLPGMKESGTTCDGNTKDLHLVESTWKHSIFLNEDV